MSIKILSEFIKFAKVYNIQITPDNLVKFRKLKYNMV